MAEDNGLSKVIADATEAGAPKWAMGLIVQLWTHLEDHRRVRVLWQVLLPVLALIALLVWGWVLVRAPQIMQP